MAMQLFGGSNANGSSATAAGTHGTNAASAVRASGRLAIALRFLGQMAARTCSRIKSAQSKTSRRKQMQLVESLALGNRRQLLLVVCDNQRYLVGAGADSVGSILAMEATPVTRDQAVKGLELVRRRGRDAAHDARSKLVSQAGLDLWP